MARKRAEVGIESKAVALLNGDVSHSAGAEPAHVIRSPTTSVEARVYVGDCRGIIPKIAECAAGRIDLIFADPPFNWNRGYDHWDDSMPREDYLQFTREWIAACEKALSPTGSFWVNIPDDSAAEIVLLLKGHGLRMINWCVWHYRFGQNRQGAFINSKVHALYFARQREVKNPGFRMPRGPARDAGATGRTWNVFEILEPSDRATTYFDPRTQSKRDGMPPGMRTPLDTWYGKFWGRVQGNNAERRHGHDNQLPEAYLERVIRACSNEGDLVMDPFLGSGTTGVVAHALSRRFIGIEYSKDFAASALERMKEGPVRLGQALNQSTAIFPARGIGPKSRKRFPQAAE